MFHLYEKYLEYIDAKIAEFFTQAEPFVFCKEGCSYCCEKGQYPYSELEFKYLLFGSLDLSPEETSEIDQNIIEIKKLQKESKERGEEKFLYRCPFLINKRCSVYKHRGIICRTHGLAFYLDEIQNFKIPACFEYGLNYSNVVDEDQKLFSREKFEKLGIKQEPLAYNLSLKFLLNCDVAKVLGLNFGENRLLADWLQEEPVTEEKE